MSADDLIMGTDGRWCPPRTHVIFVLLVLDHSDRNADISAATPSDGKLPQISLPPLWLLCCQSLQQSSLKQSGVTAYWD
jgi:hypothetical protein